MIWKKAFRETGWKLLLLFVLLEIHLLIAIWIYPDFKKNFEVIAQFAFAKVPVVKDLLQMTGASGYPGYILIQHFFKALNVLGSVVAVLLGMSFIAKEVENRTIEIFLSRPISRAQVFLAQFATGSLLFCAVILASCWSAIPFSQIVEEELPQKMIWQAAIHSCLFFTFLHSGCLFISVLCSEQMRVVLIAGTTLLTMMLLYFVNGVRAISVYQWHDLGLFINIHRSGEMPYLIDGILLAGIGVFTFLSIQVLKKRDF